MAEPLEATQKVQCCFSQCFCPFIRPMAKPWPYCPPSKRVAEGGYWITLRPSVSLYWLSFFISFPFSFLLYSQTSTDHYRNRQSLTILCWSQLATFASVNVNGIFSTRLWPSLSQRISERIQKAIRHISPSLKIITRAVQTVQSRWSFACKWSCVSGPIDEQCAHWSPIHETLLSRTPLGSK